MLALLVALVLPLLMAQALTLTLAQALTLALLLALVLALPVALVLALLLALVLLQALRAVLALVLALMLPLAADADAHAHARLKPTEATTPMVAATKTPTAVPTQDPTPASTLKPTEAPTSMVATRPRATRSCCRAPRQRSSILAACALAAKHRSATAAILSSFSRVTTRPSAGSLSAMLCGLTPDRDGRGRRTGRCTGPWHAGGFGKTHGAVPFSRVSVGSGVRCAGAVRSCWRSRGGRCVTMGRGGWSGEVLWVLCGERGWQEAGGGATPRPLPV